MKVTYGASEGKWQAKHKFAITKVVIVGPIFLVSDIKVGWESEKM